MERVAILVTAVVSIAVTGLLGFWLIPWLKKLKYGQSINTIGPTWHQKKEGTPTMGGIMMMGGTVCALAVGYITLVRQAPQFLTPQYAAENVRLFASITAALAFGMIGFVDDYIKVAKHRNLGLTAGMKVVPQVAVAAAYLFVLYRYGELGTVVEIPFIGSLDFGILYYFFGIFTIVGFVNAVNLTDGLDGLAASVTFSASLAFIVIAALLGYVGTALNATAIAGACVGFIIWNFYPARVFMGDCGSMFLGGAVVSMAFAVSFPLLLVLCGFIYLCEAGSVMLQIGYFKLTHGKRIFKMSPIHHHFEMCGWTEVRIVLTFTFVNLIGCAAGVAAAALI